MNKKIILGVTLAVLFYFINILHAATPTGSQSNSGNNTNKTSKTEAPKLSGRSTASDTYKDVLSRPTQRDASTSIPAPASTPSSSRSSSTGAPNLSENYKDVLSRPSERSPSASPPTLGSKATLPSADSSKLSTSVAGKPDLTVSIANLPNHIIKAYVKNIGESKSKDCKLIFYYRLKSTVFFYESVDCSTLKSGEQHIYDISYQKLLSQNFGAIAQEIKFYAVIDHALSGNSVVDEKDENNNTSNSITINLE